VEKDPYITFHSTKITQTSPNTFDVAGTFTLRGISKPESLAFAVDREAGGATGEIKGVLTIDRRDFGLGGGIKFVTIADRVDLTIDFKATRVGPPLVWLLADRTRGGELVRRIENTSGCFHADRWVNRPCRDLQA